MEEGQKFIRAAMKDLKKKEKSEIERLKAENARLREAMQKAYDFLNRKHVMDASAKITLEKALEQ